MNTKVVNQMSYENKEYILQFFEGVHEEENRTELIEVYRKAEAFDEIVRFMEYQQAYDLTDSMVIQDIDYAIRKVFTEVEQLTS